MKKLLGILVVSLLWSSEVYALSQSEAIQNFFSERKLEKIEGIWSDSGGFLDAYVKQGSQVRIFRISGGSQGSGTIVGELTGSRNSYSGKCFNIKGGWSSTGNLRIDLHGENSGGGRCASFSFSITRVWPNDLSTHNEGGGSTKVRIASMIDDAKDKCKVIGFREGTDKFADCALKLYSQSVELAAKQNQTVVMQPQSSGSSSMTIYDPVRDSNALIKQGQRMLSGRCTLGIDC